MIYLENRLVSYTLFKKLSVIMFEHVRKIIVRILVKLQNILRYH